MKLSQKFTIPLAAFALIAAGAASTIAYQSHAQTTADATLQSVQTSEQSEAQMQDKQFDRTQSGYMSQDGVKEELLTGETGENVKPSAVPDTITEDGQQSFGEHDRQ